MENTIKKDNEFTGTVFASRMALKGSKILSIQDWIKVIKSDRFKTNIEKYRALLAEGKKEEAHLIKEKLPAFISYATCMNGRKEGEETSHSSILMADYDNHNATWSCGTRDNLKNIPWIVASHRTPSDGLRVFIYVPGLPHERFKEGLHAVLTLLDSIVGYEHDPQATNPLRLSFASYDPDAWYREPEACEGFPIKQFLAEPQLQPAPQAAAPARSESKEASAHTGRSLSDTQLDQLLAHFQETHVFAEGGRNNFLVSLGNYAYYQRLSRNDLQQLTNIAIRLFKCKGFNEHRITTAMEWGYDHGHNQKPCRKSVSQNGKSTPEANSASSSEYSEYSENSDLEEFFIENAEEDMDEIDVQSLNDIIIEQNCPTFPDNIFDLLPDLIKLILSNTDSKRVRDMDLLSIFTVLSAAMPEVRIHVRDKYYSTNMFSIIIAPAGSGKSVVLKPVSLLSKINEQYRAESLNNLKEYRRQLNRWNYEKRVAEKEGREVNSELEPVEGPRTFSYIASTNTSRSQLIIDLQNAPEGVFIATSELDTLTTSLNSDYGKQNGQLRAIAMNEPVDSNFKGDGHLIRSEFPCLSLLASGTPDQLVGFITDKSDGMPSRILTLLINGNYEYNSWADSVDEEQMDEAAKAYEKATDEVTNIFNFLKEFPTKVIIPKEQRQRADQYLRYYTERLKEEGYQNLLSIPFRASIHIGRFCGILAGIRKAQMGYTGEIIEATEDDMTIALGMVRVLIRHACLSTTMLPEQLMRAQKMKNVFSHETIYKRLADEFTTKDLESLCSRYGGPRESSMYYMMKKWTEKGIIKHVKRGVYTKVDNNLFSSPTEL